MSLSIFHCKEMDGFSPASIKMDWTKPFLL